MKSPIANPVRQKHKTRMHIVLAQDCLEAARRLTQEERRNISNLIEVLIISRLPAVAGQPKRSLSQIH